MKKNITLQTEQKPNYLSNDMKTTTYRILIAIFVLAFATSCNNEEKDIQRMCEEMAKQYPASTLQDVYKTCYQDFFGAEHIASDEIAARFSLQKELKGCHDADLSAMPKKEPTGFRHRFTRINLSCVIDGEMSEDELLKLFLRASSKDNKLDKDWAQEWEKIEKIALQVSPGWNNPELQDYLKKMAKENQPVRHSDAFRKAYNPHYRIVKQ